jgi:hypothetical protein
MSAPSLERVGGACVIFGATLLAAYGVLFVLLLPIGQGTVDYARLVLNPYWMPLALVALVGVISILAGVDAIYARVRRSAGVAGTIGLLLTKVALVLQACILTWELLLHPIIAAHPDSVFLLRDRVIVTSSAMKAFQWAVLTTIGLGAPLFGFAVFRSAQFPRGAILLIVLGAVVYAIGPPISVYVAVGGVIMCALGFVLIGARLWRPPISRPDSVAFALVSHSGGRNDS